MSNITIEVKGFTGTVIYFVIGLMIDYWLYLPVGITMTEWTNIWTYAVMVFWPFVLLYEFFVLILYAAIAIGIVVLGFVIWEAISNKVKRKQRRISRK